MHRYSVFRQVFWTRKTVSELQPEKSKLYVFMQKIRNSIREKMFLSIIFESYGTYEQKKLLKCPISKAKGTYRQKVY